MSGSRDLGVVRSVTGGRTRAQAAPKGLGTAGKALWRSFLGKYELQDHELVVLAQVAKTADRIAALDAVVDDEGAMEDGTGRVHPALIESRQQRLTLGRLITSLRLPDEDGHRPQGRRLRGFYNQRSS